MTNGYILSDSTRTRFMAARGRATNDVQLALRFARWIDASNMVDRQFPSIVPILMTQQAPDELRNVTRFINEANHAWEMYDRAPWWRRYKLRQVATEAWHKAAVECIVAWNLVILRAQQ